MKPLSGHTVGVVEGEYILGRPHPALARHVQRYLGYHEYSPVPVHRRQAPAGSCTLILSLGPPIRLHGPAGPTMPSSFLAGMHDTVVHTEFRGHQHGLQVDLGPLGVFALLGRPMPELTNLAPQLSDVDDPELARLPERLADLPDWPSRFALLDVVFLRRLADEPAGQADPEVAWAWQRLRRSAGRAEVGELAEGTGWSRRHLLTRFRGQVGLTPKAAARVLRFERASLMLAPWSFHGTPPAPARSIADVAAACGYADHAHLVREFHALAGCTPTAYRAGW